MTPDALRARFEGLFDGPSGQVFEALGLHYAEPQRRYHTLNHIADCLEQLDASPPCGAERRIELALWWHDAIYDPAAPGNEAASAALAIQDLAGLGEPESAEVGRLTAGHRVAEGAIPDARLVSVDLSILGRSPEVYDRYVAAVRAEYAHAPEEAWRIGRARVMASFLEGPVFADPWFEDRYGAVARDNIQREIAALSAG